MRKRSQIQVQHMQCIAGPSAALRARMGVMYPEKGTPQSNSVVGILDDLVKVDALAALLTEAIQACRTADGRMDERDVAVHVLRGMMRDGQARRPRLSVVGSVRKANNIEAMAVDMMAATAFGRLITRAIEATQDADGLTKMQNVAVYVLRAMKQARVSR